MFGYSHVASNLLIIRTTKEEVLKAYGKEWFVVGDPQAGGGVGCKGRTARIPKPFLGL